MISKQGIRDFLSRPLDDFSWMKEEEKKELEVAVSKLPKFGFYTEPYVHQLVGFLLGVYLPDFLYLLDMGLGKTKILLDVFRFRQLYDKAGKGLVTVPRDVNIEGWLEEVDIHSELDVMPLIGSTKEKWEAFKEPADLYVVSYQGLYTMLSTGRGTDERKLKPDEKACRKMAKEIDFFVADEIHKAKNKKSLTFRICNRLAKNARFRYGLTGTPFGREPKDLWAQFFLIDRGKSLGTLLGMFNAAFYIEGTTAAGYPEHTFDRKKMGRLNRMVRNRSIRYEDEECQDLPDATHQTVPIVLSVEAASYYLPAKKAMIDAMGNYQEVKINFTRMREICSGFFRWKEDETRVQLSFASNPKLDALRTIIEGIPNNRKAIILHLYKPSGKMIEDMLKKLSIPHVAIHGGMKKGKDMEAIRKFKQDPKVKIMVANIDMVSHGGNYQVANYTVFYEEPTSVIDFRQCLKRTRRTGQTRRTHYIYLTTTGTVEEDIHSYAEEGKDLFEAIIEGAINV